MILRELVNSVEALNALSALKLPAKVSYKLGVFIKDVSSEVDMYNKTRNDKLEIFGEKSEEDPTKYVFVGDNGKKFVEEMKELEEAEITKIIPEIKLEDLGDVVIEPKHLLALNWLIKE